MARMVVSAVLITFAVLASIWLLLPASYPATREITKMSTTASDLEVELQAISPGRLKITITNRNADHPFTFLRWDTPLDPLAPDMGVLVLIDSKTGKVIPGPGLKLNRVLPPAKEDFVEVAPNSEVSEELQLRCPWLPKAGERVKVYAEGEWKALWDQSLATVKQEALDTLAGDGSYRDAFRSQAVELEI